MLNVADAWVLQIVRLPHKSNSQKLMLVLTGFPDKAKISRYINGIFTNRYDVHINGKAGIIQAHQAKHCL